MKTPSLILLLSILTYSLLYGQCPNDFSVSYSIVENQEPQCYFDLNSSFTATTDQAEARISYYIICFDAIYTHDVVIHDVLEGEAYNSYSPNVEAECDCSVLAMLSFVDYSGDNLDCGSYDGTQVETNVVVPAKLAYFKTKKTGQKGFIWKTLEEINVSHYELQFASDGTKFKTLETIPSNNRASDYFIQTKPKAGYYRLAIIDRNGDTTFSDILYQKSEVFEITNNQIELSEATEILVFNLAGQLLYKETTRSLDLNKLQYFGIKLVRIQDMTVMTL